jgi:hypothetical protein
MVCLSDSLCNELNAFLPNEVIPNVEVCEVHVVLHDVSYHHSTLWTHAEVGELEDPVY